MSKGRSRHSERHLSARVPLKVESLRSLSVTINWRGYGMVLALVLIALVFQYLTEGLFLSSRNIVNLLRQASLVGLLAVGMVLVLVSANIDLSAGSAVGLTATVAAWLQVEHGWAAASAVLAALFVGLVCGIWQGVWVARLKVLSFVVTLGGLLIFRGALLVIGGGATISPLSPAFQSLGQSYVDPGLSLAFLGLVYAVFIYWGLRARSTRSTDATTEKPGDAARLFNAVFMLLALGGLGYVFVTYRGIPIPVLILAMTAIILTIIARRTKFGRNLYAIGGNRDAARFTGINIRNHIFGVFVIMGILYGIVGVLMAARLNSAPPNAGFFMELEAIAAAVLGGTSLMGGVGTVSGAVIGALLMQSIANGLSLMNVSSFYQMIVTGLLLIVAVYVDVAMGEK